jgi:hypothetical protein
MNHIRFDRKSNPGQGHEDVWRLEETANITARAHASNEAGLNK